MSNDYVLMINKSCNYCVNITNPQVEPLYSYYRKRIGSVRWPLSDTQRFLFERMIVNMCTEGLLRVKHWVLHEYFNVYKLPRYMEHVMDYVPAKDDINIPYMDIKKELQLIAKALKAAAIGSEYTMSKSEESVFSRVKSTCSSTAALIERNLRRAV